MSWFLTLGGALDNRKAVANVERVYERRRLEDAQLAALTDRLSQIPSPARTERERDAGGSSTRQPSAA